MQLKLKSDFLDYYDAQFDMDGKPFERFSSGGMSRREMLAFLQEKGYPTPAHGAVSVLATQHRPDDRVVVYLDERQHKGEGKLLLTYEEALHTYPNHYATEYVFSEINGQIETWRYLQLGSQSVWLKYRSDDSWRSNCGEVEVEIVGHHLTGKPWKIDQPLYAIDYVGTKYKYAVDYNIAPGLRGTGLENVFRPKEVVDLIKSGIIRIENEKMMKKGALVRYGC